MPTEIACFCAMCGTEITSEMRDNYECATHPYLGLLCPECTMEAEDCGLDLEDLD